MVGRRTLRKGILEGSGNSSEDVDLMSKYEAMKNQGDQQERGDNRSMESPPT